MEKNILIMGASGQIGSELYESLSGCYGEGSVIASDIKTMPEDIIGGGIFELHDCLDADRTADIVRKYAIKTIYNMPAILSVTAEGNPQHAFNVNMIGLYNTLEVARTFNCAVFTPSSIAVFGDSTPKENTPQDTLMRPQTMYGISKLSAEMLCDYYHKRYGVDTRGLRYPGIISYKTPPGGGTTDFAVEIYYDAVRKGSYVSCIGSNVFLDMMYMPDAIRAAVEVMEADASGWNYRNAFNITSMSVNVNAIADAIRLYIPDFSLTYDIDDVKQNIAESWPDSIDDTEARDQWAWKPRYDLHAMTEDMLKKLKQKLHQ